MKVSIIIPVLNEAQLIVESLERAIQSGADEVIVVDGGSRDGTAELVERMDCQLVVSGPGRGAQMNLGATRAEGDVLLFQHADAWLHRDALPELRRSVERTRVVSGAFRQRIDANGAAFRLLESGNAARVRWLGLPYGDQGIFVRTEVFRELGGFPEVQLMEDVLLMRRLRRKAWPVLLGGPIHVHPRRWQRHGVVRQTLRNWFLLTAHLAGVSPNRLVRFYTRHDS